MSEYRSGQVYVSRPVRRRLRRRRLLWCFRFGVVLVGLSLVAYAVGFLVGAMGGGW